MARTKCRTRKKTPRDWKPLFIRELCQRGNVSLAVEKVGIGRRTAYDAREKDEAFRLAWDEAVEMSVEFMEAEARRRAVEGTLRPVYQGKKLVGKVREYSDTLLIFLLKAHKPEKYRDRHAIEHSGALVETHIFLPPKDEPPS